MIKFSNFPTTVLKRVAAAADTTLYVDAERLRSFPSVDPNDVKEGVFIVIEDVYGHYEACYASRINLADGQLEGVVRGLGNMPAQDWNDISEFVRVEIRPSAQVMQRMIQRDGDELHGGWWDKQSDPWATPPSYATDIITRYNDKPAAAQPADGALKPGQLAIWQERKTLWFGDEHGKTFAIQGGANNVVNVMDHGAIGDGQTSDSDAIDLAVADAIKRKACLFFPAGTYKLIRPIRIEDATNGVSLAIHGCGMRATILSCQSNGAWAAFQVSDPKFISIRDMSITTDTTSNWGYLAGPRIPTNFDQNVLDSSKGSTAIYIDGQFNWSNARYRASEYVVEVDNVEFSGHDREQDSGWAFGVALDDTGNAVISRCVFMGHMRDANAPVAESGGGQSGVVRFGNNTDTEDLIVTTCLAVGYTSLASCKGLANSMQIVDNTCDQTARLFSSTRISGDPQISMKFIRLAGNVVNCFWGLASIQNTQSASVTGNWVRTSGENFFSDKVGDPLPQYDILSVAAFSAMISGNNFEHVATSVPADTDIVAIRMHDSCKQANISGNTINGFQLGLMLDAGTVKCERHGNVYIVGDRTMKDTDGKVWDKSEHNIKPVGGVMVANNQIASHNIQSGGQKDIPYEDKHITINDLNCKCEVGMVVQGDGIERMLIEGLVRIADRSKYSEVEAQLVRRAHKDANVIEVATAHYYGKSAATLTVMKQYINNADHDARFGLRVINRGPEMITIKAPATLRFTVLGYEE